MEQDSNKMGLLSATFIGISAVIGSGWLFAAYKTGVLAGPAAIISWIIAAIIVILIGLCFAEVAALYPRRGLSAVLATMTHNKYFGFPFAISHWLGIVAVISLQGVATIQYLISLFPNAQKHLFVHGQLTFVGLLLAVVLVLIYALLNFWGVNLLAKTNNILTVIKLAVPVIAGVLILSVSFHPHNFVAYHNSFIPYGFNSVITAIIATGIIVSFNGFQTITYFSSEVKNPSRTIPLAIILSIVFSLIIYLLLQVAFIAGMPPAMVAEGWSNIVFNAPMVNLSAALGLGFLSTIIYFGAFVSPSGSAITLTGASTRMLTAMSDTKQMPSMYSAVNPKVGISRKSLFTNIILAALFIVLFKSWTMVAMVLGLYHVLSYLSVPIALEVFRKRNDKSKYIFRLKGGKAIALISFVVFTYLLTDIKFEITLVALILFVIFQVILTVLGMKNGDTIKKAVVQSSPIFAFLIILTILNYISPDNANLVPTFPFIIICVIFSIISYYWFIALAKKQTPEDAAIANEYIASH